MTLEQIQEALAKGKTVVDIMGSTVLYVEAKGYLYEDGDLRIFMHCDIKTQEFSIEKSWPKIGDKYYRVRLHSTYFEFAELVWEGLSFEKGWLMDGEIFRDKELALAKIKDFIDNLI